MQDILPLAFQLGLTASQNQMLGVEAESHGAAAMSKLPAEKHRPSEINT